MGDSTEQTEHKKVRVQERRARMLEALELTLGNVSEACKKSNVGRTQHYNWVKNNKKYRMAVEDIDEALVDTSESLLLRRARGYKYEEVKTEYIGSEGKKGKIVKKTVTQKVMPPNVDAIGKHLAAKGADRGYGNKLEIAGKKGAPPVEISVVKIVKRTDGSGDRGNNGT